MVSARIGVASHDADRRQQRLGTRARRPVDGIAGDRRATVGRRRAPGQGDLAVAGVGGQPGRGAGHARWRRGRQRATQEQAAQDGVAAGGPVDRDHDRVTGGHADRGVDPGAVDERVGGQAGGPRTLPVVDRDVLAARAVAVPVERVQVERSAVGGGEVEPEPDLRAVVPGPCPALGPRRGLERPDVAGRGDPAVARGLLDGQRPAGRQADQVGRAGPVGQHVAVRAVVGDPAALDVHSGLDGDGVAPREPPGVGRGGLERVEAGVQPARVPRRRPAVAAVRVRRQGDAVDEELDLGDPDVVGRVGRDRHRAADGRAVGWGSHVDGRSADPRVRRLRGVEGIDERFAVAVGVVAPLALADAVVVATGVGECPVRALAGALDEVEDVGRLQARVRGDDQGRDAGHVRRGHARAGFGLVGAARPVGVDLGPGSRHRDDGAEVAELGQRVVAVQEDEPAAALATRLTVQVGQGRDRDHLGEGSRDERRRIDGRVAGRGDVDDPRGHRSTDRLANPTIGATPDRAGIAEAHVGNADVVRRITVGHQPGEVVDRADQVRPLALARVVEHLDRHDPRRRCDPDDPVAVGGRGDDPGDMRPVPVTVLRRAGRDAVPAEPDVEVRDQVRVGEVDAGVEDRDADASAGEAGGKGARRRRVVGADPRDAGRDGVGRDRDLRVRDDGADGRVETERRGFGRRTVEHEAVERVPVDLADLTADLRRQGGTPDDRVRAGLQGDDPAGHRGGESRRRRSRGGRTERDGEQHRDQEGGADADPEASGLRFAHRTPGVTCLDQR